MSDKLVIIPTYNEKENIEKIIRAVFGLEKDFDILVIDDGSPDGTAAIVKELILHFRDLSCALVLCSHCSKWRVVVVTTL